MGAPGTPKTPGSGRKPNTPNRPTQELRERLAALNFDMVDEVVSCYRELRADDAPGTTAAAGQLLTKLMRHTHPMLKAVDLSIAAPAEKPDRGLDYFYAQHGTPVADLTKQPDPTEDDQE